MTHEPRLRGPWSRDQVREFLQNTVIPVRLATNTRSGFPTVLSLWFVPGSEIDETDDLALWCAVHKDSRIAGHLAQGGACAFEVARDAPPYHGVRGQAQATLAPELGESILRRALDRYLGDATSELAGWLLSRAAEELAIRIAPHALYSWDYRERMAGLSPPPHS